MIAILICMSHTRVRLNGNVCQPTCTIMSTITMYIMRNCDNMPHGNKPRDMTRNTTPSHSEL